VTDINVKDNPTATIIPPQTPITENKGSGGIIPPQRPPQQGGDFAGGYRPVQIKQGPVTAEELNTLLPENKKPV